MTVLEPEGNAAAEVVVELERIASERSGQARGSAGRNERLARSEPVGAGHLGRRVTAGVTGAFGGLMMFLSVVDAGVAGISEGGLLIGAVSVGVAYAVWPRAENSDQ